MNQKVSDLIARLCEELCDLTKVSTAELVAELASRFVIKPIEEQLTSEQEPAEIEDSCIITL